VVGGQWSSKWCFVVVGQLHAMVMRIHNVAAEERDSAMNSDMLMFAVVFVVAITVVCAGVVMVALNRVGNTSKARAQKRRSGYTHRAFKDVM